MPTRAESFRTDTVASTQRLTFWNEVAAATFGDIAVQPLGRDFSGRLRRVRLGALTIASVWSAPARVDGARVAQRNTGAEGWFLLLNEHGASRLTQLGHDVCLHAGELTVLRADERYRIELPRPNKTLVLHLPHQNGLDLNREIARRQHSPNVQLMIALMRRLEAVHPESEPDLARLVSLAQELAELCWPLRRRCMTQPGSGTQSRLPVADSWKAQIEPGLRSRRRLPLGEWDRRVREYVENNLASPELGAAAMARHFGVSTRFVHLVFARIGQSAAAYIVERRLTSAAQRLRCDPATPITGIALDAGFSDLSHFCRVFRRRFGVSAREYRRRC